MGGRSPFRGQDASHARLTSIYQGGVAAGWNSADYWSWTRRTRFPFFFGFSREIRTDERDFITRHQNGHSVETAAIDHHGTDDTFLEKASEVWYFMQASGSHCRARIETFRP
ncbi:MAG TPA: hypothetical protein VEQ63_16500 [Bryobacteraceae bacterium]|nr:hypothetical protein [Bryobacteraceae bacterium]